MTDMTLRDRGVRCARLVWRFGHLLSFVVVGSEH